MTNTKSLIDEARSYRGGSLDGGYLDSRLARALEETVITDPEESRDRAIPSNGVVGIVGESFGDYYTQNVRYEVTFLPCGEAK